MALVPNERIDRIALGSCAHQDYSQPIWEAVSEAAPNLFLMIGDNVYADTTDFGEMQRAYEALGSVPGFAKLRSRVPVLATWDDHDYGANDAGAEFEAKQLAKRALVEFFGVPEDAPMRQRPGVYQSYVLGPPGQRVQILLLDGRWFRSALERDPSPYFRYRPRLDSEATMLGEAQWAWLEEQLQQPAEVRLIVSGIRVLSYASGFESWKNLPLEQERLFSLLRKTRAGGVILLSGDAHFSELSRGDGGLGYPLYELTSSSLNRANPRGAARPAPLAVFPPYGDHNFGWIELQWEGEPSITLSTRNEMGGTVFAQEIPLRKLQPPTEIID
ncbi:MAG: alkaline phosphatase D family protein [Acidobacteriota bacterium]